MSASLVGSEMCIRDRAHSAPILAQSQNLPTNMRIARARGREIANTHTPVSYTHLTLPTICSV
eukprot:5704393-Alexandrium_andersonii.AAC.1